MARPEFRVNNTGRNDGRQKSKKRNKIHEQFVPFRRSMLESYAYAALNLNDRKILDRFCLEHMSHAGTENGNLKCTYKDFEQFGIRPASISDCLKRLEALGFIEKVEQGEFRAMDFKTPSIYRVTFLNDGMEATDEWKKIESLEQAKEIVKRVSSNRKSDFERKKKQIPAYGYECRTAYKSA